MISLKSVLLNGKYVSLFLYENISFCYQILTDNNFTFYTIYHLLLAMGYWFVLFIFRTLRKLFKVDPADYMISICGNDALRELSSPGKSGSFFYLTNDDRYMIKTMKKAEVKVRFIFLLFSLPPCFLLYFDIYIRVLKFQLWGIPLENVPLYMYMYV